MDDMTCFLSLFFFREETDDPREVQEYSYSQSG
jgi:hypothetical protein